jgi:hypothetical protein
LIHPVVVVVVDERAALALCALIMVAGCGPVRPGPPSPRAQLVTASAAEWGEHLTLGEHLLAIAALLSHAEASEPGSAPSSVQAYLGALATSERTLGQRVAARELALTTAEREVFEAEVAPVLAFAHQRLDAALTRLSARDANAAYASARLLHEWLTQGVLSD